MYTDFDKLNFDFVINLLIRYSHCSYNISRISCIEPNRSLEKIRQDYSIIYEFYDYYIKNDPFDFYQFQECSDFVEKISKKVVLTPIDYYEFAKTIKQFFYFKTIFGSEYKNINNILVDIKFDYSIIYEILKHISKDGEVYDSASSQLKNIRKRINETKDEINSSIDNFFKKAQKSGYTSDDIITIRENFQCIAVKSSYKNMVDGVVVDYSNTGQTAFIVPETVINLHSEFTKLKFEEVKEIERILSSYNEKILVDIDNYLFINNKLLDFDYYHSIAKFGLENGYNIPDINTEGYIKIINGKHPILSEKAIPLNVEIGRDNKILIITGPNAGGKTVCLKTIGLFTYMFLCSLPVPCEPDSSFSYFENIFVDIGDNQSIENSLSTFSSHITNIKNISENINDNSIVIIDELGRGTDPVEGEALALSLIDFFLQKKAVCLISTHFPKVKYYATTTQGILNSSMEYDEKTLSPTYRLLLGQPGKSHAFDISYKIGLNLEIIENAKKYLDEEYLKTEKIIAELQNERIKLINSNEELEKKVSNYNEMVEKLKYDTLNYKEKEKILTKMINDSKKEFLDEYRKQFEKIVKDIKEHSAKKDDIIEGKNFFKNLEEEILSNNIDSQKTDHENSVEDEVIIKTNNIFQIGDRVIYKENNNKGVVLEINKKDILVQFGIVKMKCKSEDLFKIQINNNIKNSYTFVPKNSNLKSEIDVRGKTLEEAIDLLERYIDQAILSSMKEFKIIHGHGTGILRKGIQDYLRKSPFVESFNYENMSDYKYNYGVTVVIIKC